MTFNKLMKLKYTDSKAYELALDEYYSKKDTCIECGSKCDRHNLTIFQETDETELYICHRCY